MSKPGKFVIPMLVATPLLLLLAQCSYGDLRPILIGKKIWLRDENAPLEQAIRGQIPVGSSIAEARKILELNGYVCADRKNSSFANTNEVADYLGCQLQASRLVCVRTNNAAIYYKSEVVTEIATSIGGWCL
jgi:hypothetical protein